MPGIFSLSPMDLRLSILGATPQPDRKFVEPKGKPFVPPQPAAISRGQVFSHKDAPQPDRNLVRPEGKPTAPPRPAAKPREAASPHTAPEQNSRVQNIKTEQEILLEIITNGKAGMHYWRQAVQNGILDLPEDPALCHAMLTLNDLMNDGLSETEFQQLGSTLLRSISAPSSGEPEISNIRHSRETRVEWDPLVVDLPEPENVGPVQKVDEGLFQDWHPAEPRHRQVTPVITAWDFLDKEDPLFMKEYPVRKSNDSITDF